MTNGKKNTQNVSRNFAYFQTFYRRIKKPFLLPISVLMLMIILASATESLYKNDSVKDMVPTRKKKYMTQHSDVIFDQNTLHTFEIIIPEKNLEKIDADPTAEQYVEANLKFNGEELSAVGIRYKGSVGAFVGSVSGEDWANPSGYKTATKISMKVKIDWKGADRTFYGLKKLQFHSQNLDPSQMRERLGYWLFGQMGVIAPRSVHARLVINGEYYGVYALTEQVDEQFIAENYKGAIGNLYKEAWPLNYLGEVTDTARFLMKLKTNKEKNPNTNRTLDFAKAIVNANDEELRALIIKKMNLNQIIAHIVVDRMIRNDDGPFHWYCFGSGCRNHNFYWYEQPKNQKFHLIPWDMDNAFQNIAGKPNRVTKIVDDWGEISNDCEPFISAAKKIKQKSAACDKLTRGWISFSNEFDSLKTVFLNGPFSEASVNAKLDEWSAQIRAATKEASEMHEDAITEEKCNNKMDTLRSQLKYARVNF